MAAAGLACAENRPLPEWIDAGTPSRFEAIVARAAALVVNGRHGEAAELCMSALRKSEPGPDGWLLPVEPLLHVAAHRPVWAPVLAAVANRAA
jgi:hypothetical protein